MILNKIDIPPSNLINNFIKFTDQFDFSRNRYTYESILNSGLFNVKFCDGDCEINSAFLAHILNSNNDIIEFGNIKLFKEQLYPWNLRKTYLQYKIIVYILFMKFIVGNRLLNSIEGKKIHFNFDKNMLPYSNNNLASFGDDFYFEDNKFIQLACGFHSFIITYSTSNDCYEIYDLNKKDYKIYVYQYKRPTFNKNETWFNLINYDITDDCITSYYSAATQTNHIVEYKYGSLSFDGKYNFNIDLSFNQFKYLLLAYISLDIYRMSGKPIDGKANGIKLDTDLGYSILKRLLFNPTGVNHDRLDQIFNISS
jgi:hypothetical protein